MNVLVCVWVFVMCVQVRRGLFLCHMLTDSLA